MESYEKLWYTVEKTDGTLWMGQVLARADATENEAIEIMQEYCEEKNYRLVLLIQVTPGLPIVNQIYPYEVTDEVRSCMGPLVEAAAFG